MKLTDPYRVLKSISRRLIGPSPAPYHKREVVKAIASEIKKTNDGCPVVYLDVGSSGARDPYWQGLLDEGLIGTIDIDMTDDWSRLPRDKEEGSIRIKAALGEENSKRTVFITRHPACSSCLKPDFEIIKDYPVRKWFEVVREEPVMTSRYDDLSMEKSLPQPEIVKIDVQGFEGPVLRGMGDVLDSVLCLEFECQLKSLYEGQETFMELYEYLVGKGFVLRDLKPQGPFEGEALEFNSFWSRNTEDEGKRKIVKLWEIVNNVWQEVDFNEIDAHQRQAYHFNY